MVAWTDRLTPAEKLARDLQIELNEYCEMVIDELGRVTEEDLEIIRSLVGFSQ